jgi:hypothetical protein
MIEQTPITPELIRETIKAGIESPEPAETILHVLRENDNKKVDKNLLKKIHSATKDDSLILEKDHGMTHLRWNERRNVHLLLLGYKETNLSVDPNWVYDQNPAYFSARIKRNQMREAVLHRTALIGELSEAANKYIEARKHLLLVMGVDYFQPDIYSIGRLIKERTGQRSYALGEG